MKKLVDWLATFKPKGLLTWLNKHFLELGIAFLIFFIPLYPKLPLIDIKNTWTYIRLEDFFVVLVGGFWLIKFLKRKAVIKTPLTPFIFAYWLAGLISLLYVLLFLKSHLAVFFPNVAVLHYLRRIEYMLVFFIAFSAVKKPGDIKKYLWVGGLTLFFVSLYGLGQKFLHWPAFLTMNEEFSKGIALYLPSGARVTSTFAGHYDLGVYLVFMIAIFGSLIFAIRAPILKAMVLLLVFLSYFVLLLTASRVSFLVYLFTISLMLFLQKKKWLVIPTIIVSVLLMNYISGTSQRFDKTFRVKQVVYEAKTGLPIAVLEEAADIGKITTEEEEIAGESLPLGTGFLPIQTQPPIATQVAVIRKPVISLLKTATKATEIATVSGEFLIKRAIVYDVSFTTRLQGEWPRAIEAFKRSPLLGSGFSSINLATDNDYLRSLGETGLLGLLTLTGIFVFFGLLMARSLKKISQPLPRAFIVGVFAGMVGLLLNAALIDVFEASKVAFIFWIFVGLTVGVIQLLLPSKKSLWQDFKKVITTPYVAIAFLIMIGLLILTPALKNYFIGDDFTWLRWAFNNQKNDLWGYFIKAEGFFYRPLTKLYFFKAVPFFELKPQGYHFFSLLLHLGSTVAAYLIVLVLTRRKFASFLAAVLFLVHPINGESVFWIASTSQLLASFFYLWGFLAYLVWRKVKPRWNWLFLILTVLAYVLSLLSHEKAITFPLMIIVTDLLLFNFKLLAYLPLLAVSGVYFWLRNSIAQAHWLSGDYSYNWRYLPFNFGGNLIGYLGILLAGEYWIPIYDRLRVFGRLHKQIVGVILLVVVIILGKIFRKIKWKTYWQKQDFRLFIFGLSWLLILLLPFLGLGNLAERYVHPASLGFFLIVGLLLERLVKIARKKSWLILISLLILILSLVGFYIWEINLVRSDWYQAGEIGNHLLLSLASNYTEFGKANQLYFVNLPIRFRRAWVFPVGLDDALWFVYKDDSMRVYKESDLKMTLDMTEKNGWSHVFVYQDGELKEAKR